jgi:hypothetical protein
MSEKKYPQGINAYRPKPQAPSFVVSNIVIKKDEFIEWLNSEDNFMEDEIRLDLLLSKDGAKHNLQINTYKKQG